MLASFDKMMIIFKNAILIDKFCISRFLLENKKIHISKGHLNLRIEALQSYKKKKCKFIASSISVNHCINLICCFQYEQIKPFYKKGRVLLFFLMKTVD